MHISQFLGDKGFRDDEQKIDPPFHVLKSDIVNIGEGFPYVPFIIDHKIIAFNAKTIIALDVNSFKEVWRVSISNDPFQDSFWIPMIYKNKVLVHNSGRRTFNIYDLQSGENIRKVSDYEIQTYLFNGQLFGFDFYSEEDKYFIVKYDLKESLKDVWREPTQADWSSRVLMHQNRLVFNTDTGFHCHDWETGRFLWEYEVIEYANPYEHLLWNEQVIIPRGDGVVSLDIHTGQAQWQQNLPFAQGTIYGDKVHLIDAQRYAVLDAKTGTVEANVELTSNYQGFEDRMQNALTYGLAVTEDYAIYGSSSGYLFIIDKWTGELVWHLQRPILFNTTPLVEGNRIYVAGAGYESANILVIEGSE